MERKVFQASNSISKKHRSLKKHNSTVRKCQQGSTINKNLSGKLKRQIRKDQIVPSLLGDSMEYRLYAKIIVLNLGGSRSIYALRFILSLCVSVGGQKQQQEDVFRTATHQATLRWMLAKFPLITIVFCSFIQYHMVPTFYILSQENECMFARAALCLLNRATGMYLEESCLLC